MLRQIMADNIPVKIVRAADMQRGAAPTVLTNMISGSRNDYIST